MVWIGNSQRDDTLQDCRWYDEPDSNWILVNAMNVGVGRLAEYLVAVYIVYCYAVESVIAKGGIRHRVLQVSYFQKPPKLLDYVYIYMYIYSRLGYR